MVALQRTYAIGPRRTETESNLDRCDPKVADSDAWMTQKPRPSSSRGFRLPLAVRAAVGSVAALALPVLTKAGDCTSLNWVPDRDTVCATATKLTGAWFSWPMATSYVFTKPGSAPVQVQEMCWSGKPMRDFVAKSALCGAQMEEYSSGQAGFHPVTFWERNSYAWWRDSSSDVGAACFANLGIPRFAHPTALQTCLTEAIESAPLYNASLQHNFALSAEEAMTIAGVAFAGATVLMAGLTYWRLKRGIAPAPPPAQGAEGV